QPLLPAGQVLGAVVVLEELTFKSLKNLLRAICSLILRGKNSEAKANKEADNKMEDTQHFYLSYFCEWIS
ncbi:hypothetical protein CWC28_22365, partial [Pseudoalteromonas sp. S4492]|uniref:hypothetical protein n=1 Tax=Pseudoalteromonas sp. S4492 TaxID=579560 RepID=UPI0012700DEC